MKHDKFPLICVTVVEFEVMLQSDPDLASFDIFSCDFFLTFQYIAKHIPQVMMATLLAKIARL